jgi:hypothetical protein
LFPLSIVLVPSSIADYDFRLTTESAVKRSDEIIEETLTTVDGALAVVSLQKGILEGVKGGLERSMSAQQMGSRIAAEKKVAKDALAGDQQKALKVRGDSTIAGKKRAENAAMEMAKGTFPMPVSER